MADFSRGEWLALDNFCRTHPAMRKLLSYLCEHPEEEHTVQSVGSGSGMAVSFFDLKALFIYKLLTAVDAQGQPIRIAWDLAESSRYRLIKEKIPLIRVVLERRQPVFDAQGRVIWKEGAADVVVASPPEED